MKINLSVEDWSQLFADQEKVSPNTFWVVDLNYSEQLYLSNTFQDMWGIDSKQVFEHPELVRQQLISETSDHFYKRCVERHNSKERGSTIYKIKDTSGNEKYIYDRFMTLYTEKGEPIAAAGIAMNVTDKMDLVQDKRVMQEVISQHEQERISRISVLKEKLNILAEQKKPELPKLTRREMQCAFYLIQGSTAKETAEKLFITRKTVEKHIASMKEKFQCQRKMDLLKILMTYNIINPN